MENNTTTPIFNLDDFKCNVNYAIEASAGTGKTFNITQIVKKLIDKYRIGLDQILIVTYTEKAAGELKDRIREALATPIKDLNNQSIKQHLLGKVNCDVDNANIGTIHSFCQNTLNEFAFSSRSASKLQLADPTSINYFAKKYIRQGDILKDITFLLSLNQKVNEDKLIAKLINLTNQYYLNFSYNQDDSIVKYKPQYQTNQLENLIFKLYFSTNVEQTLKEYGGEEYDAYLILKDCGKPEASKFIDLFDRFKDFLVDTTKKASFKIMNQKYDEIEKKSFELLFDIRKTINDLDVENYLVDKYLDDFYKSFQLYKEENRLQTFNDMIRSVRELVVQDDSELLKCLKKKYRYAIIDEFQDTNQLQFDIFKTVFISEGHNIIIVGDPKQSIYSFQGADVTVYQKAVELISKNGRKCRLAKNYRSAPGVVEFGNELFKHYTFETGFEPSTYCMLDVDNKERRFKFKGEYVPSLWLSDTKLSAFDNAYFALNQIVECTSKGEDGHTNLQISECDGDGKLTYRDVKFSDFVILSRTRTEVPYLQNALINAGIPTIKYKDASLFNSIECASWIVLLEAIEVDDFTGKNRGYFKKALFSKFFKLSLQELSLEKYDSDDNEYVYLFNNWKILANQKLWQDLFDSIIVDTYLETRMSSLSDMQSLAILKQIASYCIDFLSLSHSLADLIKHLQAVRNNNDELEEDGASIIAKATEFNCVSIMTMHASKGLQFPVVISLGGLKGANSPSNSCYKFHELNQNGVNDSIISLTGSSAFSKERDDEFFRLFYVAYTRSEYLLIAPRYELNGKQGLPDLNQAMEEFIESSKDKSFEVDGTSLPYYLLKPFNKISLDIIKPKVNLILQEEKDTVSNEDPSIQIENLSNLIRLKKERIAYKHSYSSLTHTHEDEEEVLDDVINFDKEGSKDELMSNIDLSAKPIIYKYDSSLVPLEIPADYPKGSGLGNSIHEIFERLDFTSYETNLDKLIKERFKYNGFNIFDKEEWVTYTTNIIDNVLNASLPVVKGASQLNDEFYLKDVANPDKKAEIEFNFNYPNEILKNYLNGFIDLLFKRGDVYSVLDWKSDTLSEDFTSYSDPSELKKHVDKAYAIQRVLYSYCLIKWLKQYYKLTEEEIFNNHFGGIYYVFVRGCNKGSTNGVYVQTWSSWSDLEKEFLNILNKSKE